MQENLHTAQTTLRESEVPVTEGDQAYTGGLPALVLPRTFTAQMEVALQDTFLTGSTLNVRGLSADPTQRLFWISYPQKTPEAGLEAGGGQGFAGKAHVPDIG